MHTATGYGECRAMKLTEFMQYCGELEAEAERMNKAKEG